MIWGEGQGYWGGGGGGGKGKTLSPLVGVVVNRGRKEEYWIDYEGRGGRSTA